VFPETLASIEDRIQSKENASRKAGQTLEDIEVRRGRELVDSDNILGYPETY
jgi:hypothetical protein